MNQRDNSRRSPLWIACESGREEVVKILLTDERIEINQGDSNGKMSLWIACEQGNEEIVQMLIEGWKWDRCESRRLSGKNTFSCCLPAGT